MINRINVKYPLEVYRTLKSIGAKHIQFIELLETTEPNIDFSNQKSTFELIEFTVPAVDYVYKAICYGGCPKHRIDQDSDGMKSYFCAGYKILFSVMVPYMNALAELEKNGIPLDKIMGIVDDIECGIKSQQQH